MCLLVLRDSHLSFKVLQHSRYGYFVGQNVSVRHQCSLLNATCRLDSSSEACFLGAT